jgi:hypothetical protein
VQNLSPFTSSSTPLTRGRTRRSPGAVRRSWAWSGDQQGHVYASNEESPQTTANPKLSLIAASPLACAPRFVRPDHGRYFANAAGEDAYEALKRFVVRLRADVKIGSQIVLDDDEGMQIILGPSTPADALLNLPEDVLEAAGEANQLYWDEDEGR